jgi:hypothetical protein
MTFVQPDMVELFYQALSSDSTLKATAGLKIEKIVDRKALASTSDPGNKRMMISKSRCGPFNWNCGGFSGQSIEYVKIETVVKTIEDKEDAEEICKALKSRAKQVLFSAQWLGTGWLYHREVQDQFPSIPMKTRAYHILVYEITTSFGQSVVEGDP